MTSLYFAFWTAYSLLFTFTVFSAALAIVLRADLAQVSRAGGGALREDVRNASAATLKAVERSVALVSFKLCVR